MVLSFSRLDFCGVSKMLLDAAILIKPKRIQERRHSCRPVAGECIRADKNFGAPIIESLLDLRTPASSSFLQNETTPKPSFAL
jgi:hypothetical protein